MYRSELVRRTDLIPLILIVILHFITVPSFIILCCDIILFIDNTFLSEADYNICLIENGLKSDAGKGKAVSSNTTMAHHFTA